MKKTISKKLVVSTVTLRKLTALEFEGVAGGIPPTIRCTDLCSVTCVRKP
jgi:hypothetical protein